MEVAMATKLHLHLDALDEARTFFSQQKQRIGIRRYIASKAQCDVADVAHLEFYGLHGTDPSTANRIFDALAEARQQPIDDREKCRLLSNSIHETSGINRREGYARESALYRESRWAR
jgi:hypothetical protein